jgi:hypothetical protein
MGGLSRPAMGVAVIEGDDSVGSVGHAASCEIVESQVRIGSMMVRDLSARSGFI